MSLLIYGPDGIITENKIKLQGEKSEFMVFGR